MKSANQKDVLYDDRRPGRLRRETLIKRIRKHWFKAYFGVRIDYEDNLESIVLADLGGSKRVRRILRRRLAEIAIAEHYENLWSGSLIFGMLVFWLWITFSDWGLCTAVAFLHGPVTSVLDLSVGSAIAGVFVIVLSLWPLLLWRSDKPHVQIRYTTLMTWACVVSLGMYVIAYTFWSIRLHLLMGSGSVYISGVMRGAEATLLLLSLWNAYIILFSEAVNRRDRRLLQHLAGNTITRLISLTRSDEFGETAVRDEIVNGLATMARRIEYGLPYMCKGISPALSQPPEILAFHAYNRRGWKPASHHGW